MAGTARTFAEIAKHFGVAPATVAYWAGQGAPIVKGKNNDLGKIAAWRKAWDAKKPASSLTDGERRLLKAGKIAKARRSIAKAKREEFAAAKEEGSLIPLDVAIAEASENVTAAKQHLLQLPFMAPRLKAMKTHEEIETALRAEIEYILTILSQGLGEESDD